MAFHVPYASTTFRAEAGESDNPLEFDLVPAWGADLARIKSIVLASIGLTQESDWTPQTQTSVIAAFETGAMAFVNTVTSIRGLTIPAGMALRAGIISELPKTVRDGSAVPDRDAPVAVVNGIQFSRIVGALPVLALRVASEIGKLSDKAEIDPRFFVQPSGSGGPGTTKLKTGTASNARKRSRRRGTVGSDSTATADPAA